MDDLSRYHIDNIHRKLMIDVLNITRNTDKAAEIIGIGKRTMWKWKRLFKIQFDPVKKKYYSNKF